MFVEAMGCGLPIIMSRTGAWRTLVRPETGLAVEVEDTAGLTAAMDAMIRTYDSYDPAAIAGFCEERFSESAISRRLTEVFDTVING